MARVIMLTGGKPDAAQRRSAKEPDALVVDIRYGRMARNGVTVELKASAALFALALAARPGAIVTTAEIVDLLWGGRADGGPDNVVNGLSALWPTVRGALAALGYASSRVFGRGFSAQPTKKPPARASGEAVAGLSP